MPKRNCPFGVSSPLQLKTHVNAFHVDKEKHLNEVYARTQELMLEGSLRLKKMDSAQNGDLQVQASETFKCQSCLRSKNSVCVKCAFCDNKTCSDCSRQCVSCTGMFCSLCSVVNYDTRNERCFCLGCSPR